MSGRGGKAGGEAGRRAGWADRAGPRGQAGGEADRREGQAVRPGPVLLLSGLPLERKGSFFRQLSLLAGAWTAAGRAALLAGPRPADPDERPAPRWLLQGRDRHFAGISALIREAGAAALILLGYPDQFPFLARREAADLPVFLWAQFSRPPDPSALGRAMAVPLTARTALFLREAGCPRIGPVIPHAVDSSTFSPPTRERLERLRRRQGWGGCFVVGTVGANSRRKRFDLVIRCFSLLARILPEARLLIKTDRIVSLDGIDLGALIAAEDLAGRVRILTEELDQTQMAELYALMDVYLNLSEWEGFAIPVIEAMSCGLPVLTHGLQGPAEIMPYAETLASGSRLREEGGSRLLEADPHRAAEILRTLAAEPELRRRLGEQGRAEVEAKYDVGRVLARWELLLSEVPAHQ